MAEQLPKVQPKKPLTKAVIEPSPAIFTLLDDISRKLTQNIEIANINQKILSSIQKELAGDADEGEYFRKEAIANPNTFDIIDFLAILSFPVKGYYINSDSDTNSILFGHNITNLSIDASVNTDDARFSTLKAGEEDRFIFNRKRIKNIYIKSVGGNAEYRLKAVW